MKEKIYIFALGNTGDKYKNTRHNAARILCDGFDFDIKEISDLGFEIVYIEPDCYMNESGVFMYKYLKNRQYYNSILRHTEMDGSVKEKQETINRFIICYDDKDINFGLIKNGFARSGGGHNGVKSVIDNMKTKDFHSIRIGIKPLLDTENLKKIESIRDFVLQNFNKTEIETLKSKEIKAKFKENLLQIIKEIKSKLLK